MDPDTPIRLADVLPLAFPHGGLKLSGLKSEIRRGRLKVIRIAGKDFTTLRYIEEMKTKCLVADNPHDYGSDLHRETVRPSGSSSMVGSSIALDAVNMIRQRLRER